MDPTLLLNVMLYNEPIGTLTLLPGEKILFSFNSAYIENPHRPTLSLSFKDNKGELITNLRPTRTKTSPFFSNLLPEGHLRNYLATLAGVKSQREFYLLWALGRDLPGAITLEAIDKNSWPPETFSNDHHSNHENALRFSLAGVQLKFSAIMEASGGLTIPAQGIGGSWIVKLPSAIFAGVSENEYSMLTLARQMGMDIPEIALIATDKIFNLPANIQSIKGNALAIRRFDRADNKSIHIEDFAQVFGVYPQEKYNYGNYKNIAEVLWAETGAPGLTEFIRRLVFNTLIGNADMHLKNWSLIYPDRRQAALAPGYDFIATIAYLADENMALNYVKSKQRSELSLQQLAYLALKANLPEKLVLDTAKETVARFKELWPIEQKNLPLESHVIQVINENIRHIPLMEDN